MKRLTEIKDGDVIMCARCGDMVVMKETEEAKKEFKKFNPGASFTDEEIDLVCDECWKAHIDNCIQNN